MRFSAGRPLILVAVFAARVIAAESVEVAEGNSVGATADEWVTRVWQSEDGLPHDSVEAIIQTRDGFLWLGTGAGVARFDGVHFRKFGLHDGLRSVRITSLAEDAYGAIWVGTSGGGVSRWDGQRFISFDEFPAGYEVISLAADRDGSVWIGTDKGLIQASGSNFKIMGEQDGLPRAQVRALLQDSRGVLWVSFVFEGVYRRVDGKFVPPTRGDANPSTVYAMAEDKDGSIWAGTDTLWKWNSGTWQKIDSEAGLPRIVIPSISVGHDGTLWVGTRSRGLYRARDGRFESVASEGPLSTGGVGAVMTDREGLVWVGVVAGGLHRLSPQLLRFWNTNAGLAPTAITSVAEDGKGELWVGTASRGIQRFENGRFTLHVDPAVPTVPPIIYSVTTTSDGTIWAAGEQCVFRFQPGQPTKAFQDPPIRGEAIRALCADGNSLWLGTYSSALLKCNSEGIKIVAPARTFPGTISSLVREADNTLWVGTSAGLHRWENGKIRTWTARDGLLAEYIRALHRDPDGTLWIGTLGGGLSRMKDGRFINITTREGLTDDSISQILSDDFGALWLGCNRGLMRIERQELDAFAEGKLAAVHPVAMGRNEGMLKEQCFGGTSPNAFKMRDGRLFFPTMNGLAEIDPRRWLHLSSMPPQPIIEEILVDQVPQDSDASLTVPPGHHRIGITFTAPLMRGGEWLRFRHRLDGFDHDWINVGSQRLASYDGLPPGRYTFRVAAADSQGRWQESDTRFAFNVQPFVWQTLWFRIGVVLLLAGASTTGAWWYLHRKHQLQLASLERERQQQAELAHAGRVALLGELSASLAHELKQPLAAILSNAQAALRFLKDDPSNISEVREILTDIAESDRRASEIIGRMRAMMTKGDTQLETRELNADVEQVLQLLHSELTTRRVSVEARLAPGLPTVHGDHIQLQQVLLNLVMNGCDAMQANVEEDRRLVIETAVGDANGQVRVSVVDCGMGIPSDKLEKIFEPFYSTKDSGLGMGLAICRAIIKSHGGHLWTANNPDRGATFHFTLMTGGRTQAGPKGD